MHGWSIRLEETGEEVQGKQSFFEKKDQKAFPTWRAWVTRLATALIKVFCFFSSEKKALLYQCAHVFISKLWCASIYRIVPLLLRITIECVTAALPRRCTPRSIAPDVTPVPANITSPFAISSIR